MVQKTYDELNPFIEQSLCQSRTPSGSFDSESWNGFLGCLTTCLQTLKSQCVPPALISSFFVQVFHYIDTQMFNRMCLRKDLCTYKNSLMLAHGMGMLSDWLRTQGKVYVENSLDQIVHIQGCVNLLMINKSRLVLQDIRDICPRLNITQIKQVRAPLPLLLRLLLFRRIPF